MAIKYHKRIAWFKPFVDSAHDLVDISRITHIRAFKVRPDLEELTNGSIIKYRNKYSINILTHYYIKSKEKYQHRTLSSMLEDLAHELSHVPNWEHTSDHFRLQSKIMHRFADILDKFGITDHSTRAIPSLEKIHETIEAEEQENWK